MRRQDNSAHIQTSLSRITESIFSSTRNSKARAISNKLSRFSALSVSIALSMLLAAMVLSPSAPSMLTGGGSVTAFDETITTYAANCEDAQPGNTWNLGGTACAKVTGAPVPCCGQTTAEDRRIAWVAPNGNIARVSGTLTPSAASDTYTIPLAGFDDPFAQVGTWTVQTIDANGAAKASAEFVVRDPSNASADLSIGKYGPFEISPGANINYRVEVTNKGPDAAQNVTLTDSVPANTTFISVSPDLTCTAPTPGSGTGAISCTLANLPANSTVVYTLIFNVNSGTPNGTVISNTASAFSSMPNMTNDPHTADNSASASTTVVAATSGCTVTCPSVTQSTAQCNAVVTYGTPTISGDCGGSVVCSPPSGSTFPIGNTTVTCTTQSGDSCSFVATVNFTGSSSAPTILCPSNVTVTGVNAGTATVNYPAPTTTGNCVTVVCSPPSGSVFSTGSTTVHCTATNPNNTDSCSFTVTVTSTTCALDCPDDKTVNESLPGSGSAVVTYAAATPVGPCPSLTVTCNPPSGSSFPVGQTSVNCTGKDGSNVVVAACDFTVTVNSSSTCAITCPANIIRIADATCTNDNPPPINTPCTIVTYVQPTTTGTCLTLPSCAPPSGSSFGVGTTTVHCTATDLAGNTSSCSFTVTVTGGTPCTITCPSVPSQPSDSGGCTKVVTYPSPTTTGSCGDPNDPLDPNPWSCNPPSGSVFPVGTTTVTCSTDVGTECSFPVTITGTDTVAPVIISCATPTFAFADSSCQAAVPNVTNDVEASDNCTPAGLLTVTQNPAAGTLVGIGTTTITVTAKDANNNNSSTCSTTFEVFELTDPIALCKPFTVALNGAGNASITGANVDNGSSDNCGITSRTVTPSTFTCANKGANTVTLTVTDGSGNSASCQTTVTVVDNTPPTITCPANITKNNDPGQCSAVVTYANATATDNCSGVGTPVCTPASGSAFQKGTTTVTCTVSDASGNPASCMFTVTVNDTQPPTIACLSDIIADFDPAVNGAIVTYATPVGIDNCPGAVTTQPTGLASGATFPVGTTTNTFMVTDLAGLTAQCSFKVTVALTSIIGLNSVSITGSGLVDSYDSNGGYPATKGSLANVLSNGTITMGNSGKVSGNVLSTGAGVAMSGASQVTGNATAGTTVSRSGSATVGGTITNNQLAPVMTLPLVPACGPPYSPNSGISGTYSYNPSTGDLSLSGVNIATLANGTYCFHNVTLTNSAQLKVNGPVVIKITGTLNASGATSLTNTTAIPGNLRILSSSSGSNGVTLSNGTNAYLVIYAPNTGVTITGAAPLFGTVAGKTLTISNSGMIHYDTRLKSIWPDIWSLIQ
jgi:uncharacterized repeat protein (TIGR01451 family)